MVNPIEVVMPTGVLTITTKPGKYSLPTLVDFAARANAKRGFLFVSKVLGKHWPAKPSAMRDVHESLASQIPPNLPGPVVFISMAETGIGLGQGVFEAYLDAEPSRHALFMHTTRYRVGDHQLIEFAEEHSHAPRQFLHMPADVTARAMLMQARSIILVDDESSTGNTFVNLAAACRSLNQDIAHVHLVTLTNFMGHEANAKLAKRFGLPVTYSALLDGAFSFTPGQLQPNTASAQRYDPAADRGASDRFGRLGMTRPLSVPQQFVDQVVQQIGHGERVLVLGTGEFMHSAFLLGHKLELRDIDVVVQSSTRSPILEWGAIANAITFQDNYGEGIPNFLYNVRPGQYDHVFICHETAPNEALLDLATQLNGHLFHFRSENLVEEIPVR